MAEIIRPELTPDYYRSEKPMLVLMNGGTIDAERYDDTPDYIEKGKAPKYIKALEFSMVPAALHTTEHGRRCSFFQMKMDDSQKTIEDETYKNTIIDFVGSVEQPLITMTFGTDAMALLAREMATRLAGTDKVIILTGAMEPLSHGKKVSDGYDNLNFAVSAGLHGGLPPGVYVAMRDADNRHQVFRADDALEKKIDPLPNGREHKYFTGNVVEVALPLPGLSV